MVYCIPMIYLFFNWKFVPFDPLHPSCQPFTPYLWQSPICSLYLWPLLFMSILFLFVCLFSYSPCIDDIIRCLSFSAWLISLITMLTVSIDVVTNSKISSFFHVWIISTMKVKSLSRVQVFVTPWTVAYHTSPSMGFSRQEYWSGFPFPSPEDLSDPGIEPTSLAL